MISYFIDVGILTNCVPSLCLKSAVIKSLDKFCSREM